MLIELRDLLVKDCPILVLLLSGPTPDHPLQ
jgi:hypothetical protein